MMSPPVHREPGPVEHLVTAIFAGLIAGLAGLAVLAIPLLLFYGVAILIFRHAYGVELPNPFAWFGLS
jgi:hypothetical protein